MRFLKTTFAIGALCVAIAVPAFAQGTGSPEGTWKDRWGTTFTFKLCGSGTDLCGVLNDIQGDSRTAANLKFVNQQVVQGKQTGPNRWEGKIAINGGDANAKVELTGPNTIKITGCRAAIFCSSIDYSRI